MFTWLRNAARNAVIGGIQDAMAEVASDPAALTVTVSLPALAAPPSPEPETQAPAQGRSKKKDTTQS